MRKVDDGLFHLAENTRAQRMDVIYAEGNSMKLFGVFLEVSLNVLDGFFVGDRRVRRVLSP